MGELLEIEPKKNSPKVIFDCNKSEFSILGRSFPENSKKFYEPIYDWLSENLVNCKSPITLDLYFYYLSSSSVIAILDLIKIFDDYAKSGSSVIINWRYDLDDEDVKRIGEDYAKIVQTPINIIEEE